MGFLFMGFQNAISFEILNQITRNTTLLAALSSRNRVLCKNLLKEEGVFR